MNEMEGLGEKTKLVCSGGLFAYNKTFFEDFATALIDRNNNLEPIRLTEPASLGALSLGIEAE